MAATTFSFKHVSRELTRRRRRSSPETGQQVKAVVQLRAGHAATDATATEIIDYARQHLARYKASRSVDFVEELRRLAKPENWLNGH
jgi:acyl-CoA synthetase (AMP-forming)/AMP-acid ligase II